MPIGQCGKPWKCELDVIKVASPVLRGLGAGNGPRLPGYWEK